MGKPGATLLTLAGYAFIGALAGSIIGIFVKDIRDLGSGFNPLLLVVIPAVIGIIQRTSTDKQTTWYQNEARIAGIILGGLAGFAW